MPQFNYGKNSFTVLVPGHTDPTYSHLICSEHLKPEKSTEDHAVDDRLAHHHAAADGQHPHRHLLIKNIS